MTPHWSWYRVLGFLGSASGKGPACQCRRHKRYWFDPWIRKIPWRRHGNPLLLFLPGESHGRRSLAGYKSMGSQRVRHDWVTEHAHTHVWTAPTGGLQIGLNAHCTLRWQYSQKQGYLQVSFRCPIGMDHLSPQTSLPLDLWNASSRTLQCHLLWEAFLNFVASFPEPLYSWFLHITHARVCVQSCFSRVRLFVTPWTVAHQTSLSLGFSRQEY